MRFFDTHTHVNFKAFENDADEAIKRALNSDTWLINVGTQQDTSQAAVELAKKYPEGVYAAIGLHPIHTWLQLVDEEESHFQTREESFDASAYESLLTEKVIGVGECGLDYFRVSKENVDAINKQKSAFVAQIEFAKRHGLPLIVHCRDLPDFASTKSRRAGAYEDVLQILKAEYTEGPGVIHSFTDTWETAKKFVDFGFYVAFNGILTFDKTGKLTEAAANVPMDRILTETDAPYLTPPPNRGKRNEPSYVRYVAQKIAEVRNMDTAEVAEATFKNACNLFKIQS